MYVPDAETPTAVFEVKAKLSGIRMVRNALVQLVSILLDFPQKRAYLLLVDSRISQTSLDDELGRLQAALRPAIAERLFIITANEGNIKHIPPGILEPDLSVLREQVALSAEMPIPLPRPDMQFEVLKVLLHQWTLGRGPATYKWLQETVGCAYRTVANIVDRLGPAILRLPDRRIQLRCFPRNIWDQAVAEAPKARGTILFADRSGQPRSPESLLRRLRMQEPTGVAVGGVLGAKRFCPSLDIVSSPRLDLCIHAASGNVNLDFVQRLDPGLQQIRHMHEPATLAVHFLRRAIPLFDEDPDGTLWGDPVECLFDLYEARLGSQADEFSHYLESRGDELSGND